MDSIRSPIWVGWLVWTSYGPDRVALRIGWPYYLHNDITGALPPSATGRGLSRVALGRTERTARIGVDIAV